MKLFKKMKDGGAESTVTGYWLIEWKKAFSIVLLKFEGPSRRAFHTHAFNSLSIVLKGRLIENRKYPHYVEMQDFRPRDGFFVTTRDNFHRVDSEGTSWVLSFRGPWVDTWKELRQNGVSGIVTLTHGRKEIQT